jgi:hypothetical protein
MHRNTYLYLIISITAAILMRVALDPKMPGVIASIFSHPALYPLATLSYTGYLLSFVAAIHTVMLLDAWNAVDVSGGVSTWVFSLCFSLFFCINLIYATALSLLIERPFMKLR